MFIPWRRTNLDRTMLTANAEELERMLGRLRAMTDGLRRAAARPAPSHAECPSFLRLP